MRNVRAWVLALGLLCAGTVTAAAQPEAAIPVPVWEARRAALFELLEVGVAVLRSADRVELAEHPQATDFRQDNDFYYLTGLETPGSWLVLVARADGPDSAILYLPPRNPREEMWSGPQLGPGPEVVARTGASDARSVRGFESELAERLRAAPGPLFVSRSKAPASRELIRYAASDSAPPIQNLDPVVAAVRLVKDSAEIARLRRAIAITTDAMRAAMQAVEPGMHEYELEAIVEYVFRRSGAERVGFPSIVGSGPNSVVLHYNENRRRMKAGDLVVVDIGAEYGYYSADVTRTLPVSGKFTPRQRAIYELVLATQEAAIAEVRPGVTMAWLNGVARRYMREHSRGLCGERKCDDAFGHGLGHWLGMNVHDVGAYETPLRPGMVLTIEPGIYLPEEALGIRIEDDLLVTEDGAEVLSLGAPRTVAEIEALMRERASAQLPLGGSRDRNR